MCYYIKILENYSWCNFLKYRIKNCNFQTVIFFFPLQLGCREDKGGKKEVEVGVLIHLLNFFPEVIMRCVFHNIYSMY